jgi:addiction module HigA family antidote
MRFPNPIHPGEKLLDDFLLPRGVSQRAFAATLGWPPRKLNELVTGKRSITAETALQLAYTLGTSMELWMYLQVSWVLFTAAQRKRALGQPAETTAPSVQQALAAATSGRTTRDAARRE